MLRCRRRLAKRLPDLHALLRRGSQAGSRQGILDLRPGGDLRQDRRRQPQKGLTGHPGGIAVVTAHRPTPHSSAGLGLRPPHVAEIAASRPKLGFLEVHAENYMAETLALGRLLKLRCDYPVSLHGVALSLGSAEELDRVHLGRFKALIERVEPVMVSEHLAWSAIGGVYLNDLLPLPYTEESLDLFCRHVDEAQKALGLRLLIENPASYLRYHHSSIPEAEFLTEVARRTGCGILCDVNNVYVSSKNFGFELDRVSRCAADRGDR